MKLGQADFHHLRLAHWPMTRFGIFLCHTNCGHQTAAATGLEKLKALGINPRNKEPGGTGKDRWEADVYIEMGDRTKAIELQRSYQHLGDLVARQKRYARYGVGWPDTPR